MAPFVRHYLTALDACVARTAGKPSRSLDSTDWTRRERTDNLAEWHMALLPRLVEEDYTVADRLVIHPALSGPDLTFPQARLAYLRGDLDRACKLVHAALAKRPGNALAFATEIGSDPS